VLDAHFTWFLKTIFSKNGFCLQDLLFLKIFPEYQEILWNKYLTQYLRHLIERDY